MPKYRKKSVVVEAEMCFRRFAMRYDEPVSLGFGTVVRSTDKAILVLFRDGSERWIPQSVVHDDSDAWQLPQSGNVVVKRWWAEAEALA